MALAGLPIEERNLLLDLLAQIRQRLLTPDRLRTWDHDETFPEDVIRELLGPTIGLQLLFIPEEYGGMGGGARDLTALCEEMAKICVGVGTGILVIHLGSDPILVGGTEQQKRKWLSKVVEGAIVAYAATEPEAGSNLASLKTSATPVVDEEGTVTGYRISGAKQFITNGGYADFLTVLAQTPEGPSFFIVEKDMPGFTAGKPEDKHGIRSSNTAPLSFDNVLVPAENLVGEIAGQGLDQANEVFGYTRLMVACCGLGAGEAALDKAIRYARERIQFGSPLIEKQGYTHKLILPYMAKLEAARAYIEEVATRIDAGETDLQVEGALAKLFASEVGNACADAAIQALGGYGYICEYDVEKIKRDVKITTIYEGTSEILQHLASVFRWRTVVKTGGQFYETLARQMDAAHAKRPDIKADTIAAVIRLLNAVFTEVHKAKATRQQHLMFQLATLAAAAETAAALMSKVGRQDESPANEPKRVELCARVNAALCAQTAFTITGEILYGSVIWSADQIRAVYESSGFDYPRSQAGLVADMDTLRSML